MTLLSILYNIRKKLILFTNMILRYILKIINMGSWFSKKNEYKDFAESKDQDEENLYKLSHYTDLTFEEKKHIDQILRCKENRDYENLVFEGGGVKGIAYCGALEILVEYGILPKIKRFAGASAGAIMAAFLAIGYTPVEIKNIMYETDFGTFFKSSDFGMVADIIKFFESSKMGCSTGNKFESFVEKCIERKTGNPNYTFGDLYKDTGRTLVIVSTNLNREMTVYFSHLSHPHMAIKEAVRMSIPVLFMPVHHKVLSGVDLYVDGGVLDNYPIHVFDGKYPGDPQASHNLTTPNPKTLGLKLLTKDETEDMNMIKRNKINNSKDFLLALIDTFYASTERRHMRPTYWKRTLPIHVINIPMTQFDVTDKEKVILFQNGIDGARENFK